MLTGIKTRQPVFSDEPLQLESVRKSAIPGSTFGALYGAWRGRRSKNVLLTEGETDCVWADRQAQEQQLQLDCYSLPHGAGSRASQESTAFLQGTSVFTAFDPDQAGQAATERWAQTLSDAGIQCRACTLPEGLDLRVAAPELAQLMAAAR